jgi:hypothetical protein
MAISVGTVLSDPVFLLRNPAEVEINMTEVPEI